MALTDDDVLTFGNDSQTFTQSVEGGSTGGFTPEGPVTVHFGGHTPDAAAPHDFDPERGEEPDTDDEVTEKVVKPRPKRAPKTTPAETK